MPWPYFTPNPGVPTFNVPVQPTYYPPAYLSWTGPYYASDGSHVWHRSSDPSVQYARREGAKGPWNPSAQAEQATSPNLWLVRKTAPIKTDMSSFSATVWGLPGDNNSPHAWSVVCRAPLGARAWNCPRGVDYPPVPPTSPGFGVSGQVGQLTITPPSLPNPGFGFQPTATVPGPSFAPNPGIRPIDPAKYHFEGASSNSYVNGQIGPWKGFGGWYSHEEACSVLSALKNWPNNMFYRIWRYSGGPASAITLVKNPIGYGYTWGTALSWLENWCPTSKDYAVSGVSGQVGQAPGPGWRSYPYAAPYYGSPGYQYAPPAFTVPPGYFPPPLPAPPTPQLPPCPPGYQWEQAQTLYEGGPWGGTFGTHPYDYFPGGCCPPGPLNPGDCVPPINVPPQYNPCQPGWSYDAAQKKCCPPGWKWDKYLEQCVPF